jgi:hypothetical protein
MLLERMAFSANRRPVLEAGEVEQTMLDKARPPPRSGAPAPRPDAAGAPHHLPRPGAPQVDLEFDGQGGVLGHQDEAFKVRGSASRRALAPARARRAGPAGTHLTRARLPPPQGGYVILTTSRLVWLDETAEGRSCWLPLASIEGATKRTSFGLSPKVRLELQLHVDAFDKPVAGGWRGWRVAGTCVGRRPGSLPRAPGPAGTGSCCRALASGCRRARPRHPPPLQPRAPWPSGG